MSKSILVDSRILISVHISRKVDSPKCPQAKRIRKNLTSRKRILSGNIRAEEGKCLHKKKYSSWLLVYETKQKIKVFVIDEVEVDVRRENKCLVEMKILEDKIRILITIIKKIYKQWSGTKKRETDFNIRKISKKKIEQKRQLIRIWKI